MAHPIRTSRAHFYPPRLSVKSSSRVTKEVIKRGIEFYHKLSAEGAQLPDEIMLLEEIIGQNPQESADGYTELRPNHEKLAVELFNISRESRGKNSAAYDAAIDFMVNEGRLQNKPFSLSFPKTITNYFFTEKKENI
jgi:hypothetical protein